MKNKIKKIEIQNFRGFKGYKSIDVEDAEIIVLHGLNGFGKTSIFDAIEWGLTGQLSRYQRYLDPGFKANFAKEKEVLRNKYANNEDTFVKIHLNNQKVFGRKIQINSKTQDYSKGVSIDNLSFDINDLTKTKINSDYANEYFASTHLLSQEQINSFITNKKPEERYRSISINFGTSSFQAFEENHQKALSAINQRIKELEIEYKSQKSLSQKLESDIALQSKNTEDIISQTSQRITELKALSNKFNEFKITLEKDNLYSTVPSSKEILSLIEASKEILARDEKSLKDIHFLNENFEKWIHSSKRKDELKIEAKSVAEAHKSSQQYSNELKTLHSKVKLVQNSIEISKKNLSETQFISNNLEKHLSDEKKLNSLKKDFEKEKELQNELSKTISVKKEQENHILNSISKAKLIINEIDNITETLRANPTINSYTKDIDSFIKEQKKCLSDAKATIDTLSAFINQIDEEANRFRIDSILKQKASVELFESMIASLKDHEIVTQLKSLTLKFNTNLNALNESKQELERLSQILKAEELKFGQKENLLIEASEYIKTNLSKDELEKCPCPVCDTEQDYDALLRNIQTKITAKGAEALGKVKNKISGQQSTSNKILNELEALEVKIAKLFADLTKIIHIDISKNEELASNATSFSDAALKLKARLTEIINKKEIALPFDLHQTPLNKLSDSLLIAYISITDASGKDEDTKSKLVSDRLVEQNKLNESQLKSKAITLSMNEIESKSYMDMKQRISQIRKDKNEPDLKQVIFDILIKHQQELTNLNKENAILQESIKGLNSKLEKTGHPATLSESMKTINNELATFEKWIASYHSLISFNKIEMEKAKEEGFSLYYKQTSDSYKQNREIVTKLESLSKLIRDISDINKLDPLKKQLETINNELTKLNTKKDEVEKRKEYLDKLKKSFPKVIQSKILANLDPKLFNTLYKNLNPHQRFSDIELSVPIKNNVIGIDLEASENGKKGKPEYLFSSAQLNTLGVCLFLSMSLRQNWLNFDTILLDDPVQNLDDINVLALIDLLRSIVEINKKQIFISTHDERLYSLLQKKLNGNKCKFINFTSYGQVEVT